MKLWKCLLIILNLVYVCSVCGQEIFFPTRKVYKENDPCTVSRDGSPGTCLKAGKCPRFQKMMAEARSFRKIACRPLSDNMVCCPIEVDVTKAEIFDISMPENSFPWCGSPWNDYGIENLLTYYHINDTAKKLEAEGFVLTKHVVTGDTLNDFHMDNGTFSDRFTSHFPQRFFAVGGEPARVVLSRYMAIIGDNDGFKNHWFCDGVLINWEWVLTAAHCFRRKPTVVRLGEYNLGSSVPSAEEDPRDYKIKQTVLYPEYKFPGTNHDLALIKLEKPAFISRPDMNPICLPWGSEASKSHVGQQLTLTGWGATQFGGTFTDILQEVNITVFDANTCDRSYAKLGDYSQKFPNGITSETHICAGDKLGGKDACQGDSGGPIVYPDEEHRYTLAGIVSAGHGCGLKEFPGLYVPINKPKYLSWIKKVAFL